MAGGLAARAICKTQEILGWKRQAKRQSPMRCASRLARPCCRGRCHKRPRQAARLIHPACAAASSRRARRLAHRRPHKTIRPSEKPLWRQGRRSEQRARQCFAIGRISTQGKPTPNQWTIIAPHRQRWTAGKAFHGISGGAIAGARMQTGRWLPKTMTLPGAIAGGARQIRTKDAANRRRRFRRWPSLRRRSGRRGQSPLAGTLFVSMARSACYRQRDGRKVLVGALSPLDRRQRKQRV